MCFNAGIGIDADTVAWVEARQGIKRRLGHAAFATGAVLESVRSARAPHVIRIDGVDATFRSVVLALGRPYAWWGPRPLDLIPGAALEGRLHWMGLRTTRVDRVAAVVLGALTGGRHTGLGAVAGGAEPERLRLTGAQPVHVQVDGEPLGRHLTVEFRGGGSLRALVPVPA
jgi:diacylglycerol kinase family enzyme